MELQILQLLNIKTIWLVIAISESEITSAMGWGVAVCSSIKTTCLWKVSTEGQ